MGPGDIRLIRIQPGPHILSFLRTGTMPCWAVLRGRQGGQAVPQKDEREGEEC